MRLRKNEINEDWALERIKIERFGKNYIEKVWGLLKI